MFFLEKDSDAAPKIAASSAPERSAASKPGYIRGSGKGNAVISAEWKGKSGYIRGEERE